MNRRTFLASLMTASAFAQAPARRSSRPPNVVFVLADDLGWADTTPYGADLHETPNLERLAREGMRFDRAYSASPVCSPTRASILTGKDPAKLGITIWRESSRKPPKDKPLLPPVVEENLPHKEYTIAEALKDAGYFTAHIGKWHLGDAEHYAETQGFDRNIGGSVWGAPQSFFYPYRGDKHFGGEYRYVPGLNGGKPGEYLTDRLTDEAIKCIDAAESQPFFLNLWYHSVHTPIEGKPELVEYFQGKLNPAFKHTNATYAAMAKSLDENVGRVLDHLEKRGLVESTIVVFFSDNGGFIRDSITNNHPLRSGKGSAYEGGIRVPLIVRYPGSVRAGTVCHEPVSSIDLYPTLLALTGIEGKPEQNAAMDGRSLAGLLQNPAAKIAREDLFFHYPHYYETTTPVSAIVARDWKLIEYFEDGRVELYHLSEDPGEAHDLADSKPVLVKELLGRLRAWRKAQNAPMPVANPNHRG